MLESQEYAKPAKLRLRITNALDDPSTPSATITNYRPGTQTLWLSELVS